MQTAVRYGSDSRTVAMSMFEFEVVDGEGRLLRISSRRRVWISGCLARRYDPHVNAEEVVSWLDISISLGNWDVYC